MTTKWIRACRAVKRFDRSAYELRGIAQPSMTTEVTYQL